jgi:glutamate-1-semialdehyde 2,1-aminomutase
MFDGASIQARYIERTPASRHAMERASRSMTRGLTRSLSWFRPYPVVFESGQGAVLRDLDGNEYIDLFGNGLSLMHGHRHPEITEAVAAALARGTAWPGASDAQIEFAELLCARLRPEGAMRFANTGTEATMLGVKLARAATKRTMIVKAWHGYHGSYDDLEAGLNGNGEMPGRVALAEFGEIDSWLGVLDRHDGEVAAVILEPVMYTGIVTTPPDGFLNELREECRKRGVLFILDDCLMFRLAEGGSAQHFGFEPDITCLGKWIGGGFPVGAIVADTELMEIFDPLGAQPLYHGGSFNGNLIGSVAGKIAVERLTAGEIDRIDGLADRLRGGIERAGEEFGLPLTTSGLGSAFGLYVLDGPGGEIDWDATFQLHLAAVTHGVYYGSGGEFGLFTALDDETVAAAADGMARAIADVAAARAAEPLLGERM